MDLLEQPEVKATYDKCKYRVKLWEHNFKKQHGRLPSKLDIREAEKEVRFAYKTYFNLKSAAIERSFIDIEGFQSDEEDTNTKAQNCDNNDNNKEFNVKTDVQIKESVWGIHLNNKIEETLKENEIKSNVNASFSQKLFGGSKFSKRNPRKSLSFQHRKSGLSNSSKVSISQSQKEEEVELASSQDYLDAFTLLNSNNIKIVSAKPDIESQSLDLIQNVLNNDYKLRSSFNSGWVDRIIKKSGTELCGENNIEDFTVSRGYVQEKESNKPVTYDYDSDDDVIDNSEDESVDKPVLHISKKMRTVESNSSIIDFPVNNLNNENGKKTNEILIGNKNENAVEFQGNLNVNNGNIKVNGLEVHKAVYNSSLSVLEPLRNKTKKTRVRKNVLQRKSDKNTKISPKKDKPLRRTSTRSKKATNLKEYSDADEEMDDSDKDPNYSSNKNAEKDASDEEITKKSPKRRNSTKPKNNGASIDDEEHPYELEYSVKPRIKSVPRITKITKKPKKKSPTTNNEENIDKLIKTKTDIARENFEKKVASGNLNENFVRVNMKKKIYVRGKKTMNFSKYKKQMWKNKKKALCGPDMDMGGCDGGVLTCFNCGDVGHFARQCPKRKGDSLLPLSSVKGEEEEEEECPFPTLEEAEKMAEESVLAIRKSNKKSNKDDEENAGNSNDETDDEMDSDDELLLAETIKLEEYVNKLDMKEYLDMTNFVKPYYELKEDGTVIDTPDELYETLSKFGYGEFRQGQEEAVMRILSGKSTLVTLSTGSGKSLCYQLPAYIYSKREPCIALVISPLVSLMEDQVTGLPPFLKAACLHTNQTKAQREKVMELVVSGSLSILLVSPEAVAAGERSTGFGSLLRKLPPISFACIDEAHCVSQWSHNFRPSYLMICRILRERLGVTTILGLTATATVSTANNIAEHLQIPDGTRGIISDVPLPDNLRLTVSKDFNRDNALVGLLMSERFADCKSVIVYCTRRDECERIASFLRLSFRDDKPSVSTANGKKRKRTSNQAEPYHAGLSASRRRTIQKSFMSGETRIVVATVAFGMGINKSDIRSVIHYNMPGSFESYVQEIGRAGRDGLPAHCHLFLDAEGNDENELRRHIHANSMDRHVIRKLLRKIFIPCSCKTECPKHEVAFSIQDTIQALDVPEENISTLLCYLELHDNRFVQVLSPAYVQCKIISYQGPMSIRKAAKECPPLAMALALHGQQKEENIFDFPVVDVASAMGWDSGICKHKLKNLEWTTVNNVPKRSSLSVQFTNLGFRLLAPGNLTDTQLDQALDYLYKRVTDQEKMCLLQLRAVHDTLTSVTARTFKACLSEEVSKNQMLKEKIREYFNSPNPLTIYEKIETEKRPVNEEQIISDTRQLINMYRDNVFTGRAVARIFHGIQSPNYPAVIWGRCKFWRSHLKNDFHEICRISTKEILNMR